MALDHRSLWVSKDKDALKNAMYVAVERNQNLNLFMRNFADLVKLPPANKKQIDLQVLISSVIDLMQLRAEEKNVHFTFQPLGKPVIINADVEQLEQAFINIVKNAIEAIENGGEVKFAIDPKRRALNITDNGKGISEAESAQLFSPFFSTKKDGQGIGLTLVREILLNHSFDFSLKTTGQETVFKIFYGYSYL